MTDKKFRVNEDIGPDSDEEGQIKNVTQLVLRPPGHTGRAKKGHLIFDASFESGNLGRVDRINDFEYDLFVRPDVANPRFRFWFNFTIENVQEGQRVLLTVVNFDRPCPLFSDGLTPVIRSTSRPKWTRMPSSHVFYYRCPYHRLRNVLTMAVSFDKEDDVYQLSLSYPYSYSRLKNRLNFYQILTSKCNEGSQYKFSTSSGASSILSNSYSSSSSVFSSATMKRSYAATGRANFRSKHNPVTAVKHGTRGNENIHSAKGAKVISWLKRSEEDTGICFRRDCLSTRSLQKRRIELLTITSCVDGTESERDQKDQSDSCSHPSKLIQSLDLECESPSVVLAGGARSPSITSITGSQVKIQVQDEDESLVTSSEVSESIAFHGKSKTVSSIIDQKGINSQTYYPATPNGDEDEAGEEREMREDEKNLHETLDTTHTDDGKGSHHQEEQRWAYSPNASGKYKQKKVARDDLKVTSPSNYHPSSPRKRSTVSRKLVSNSLSSNASHSPWSSSSASPSPSPSPSYFSLTAAPGGGGGGGGKKVLIITCRSVPSESPASIVCQGLIDFLIGSHPVAQVLRRHTTFKIIPMLCVDGVYLGNTRTSVLGCDLNRGEIWTNPSDLMHPEIWIAKKEIQEIARKYEACNVDIYLDLRATFTCLGSYVTGKKFEDVFRMEKHLLFPKLLARHAIDFALDQCIYHSEPLRISSPLRAIGSIFSEKSNCYTLNVSAHGFYNKSTFGHQLIQPYTEERYLALGEKIALAIAHSYVMTGFIPLTQDLFPFFSSTSSAFGSSSSGGHNSGGSATPMDDSIASPSSSPTLNLLGSQVVNALNQSFHSLASRRSRSPIN